MRKSLAGLLLALLSLPASAMAAPDISGTWQGKGLTQYVLKVAKGPAGKFRGDFYSLEERGLTLNGNPISSVNLTGESVAFSLDRARGTFDGTLSADGKSIAGMWRAGGGSESITFEKATKQTEWVIDPSPHRVRFVTVEKDVQLEVLDWGGSGSPLVFLAGGGNTAHVFDSFATKFTAKHHVYAITRRGYGVSSWPAPTVENYDPDRLGDDVLAVIDTLKLDRPVLAGHSIAGEELSSIGTRHPEKISGLMYLDAGWAYAYFDPNGEKSIYVYAAAIDRDVKQLVGAGPQEVRTLIADIREMLPKLEQSLEPYDALANSVPAQPAQGSLQPARRSMRAAVTEAVQTSPRKYRASKAPILAIFAQPHACQPNCDSPVTKAFEAQFAAQVSAFEAGNPSARVVRLPNANHYLFQSNEAEVEQEMNSFMDGLSRR